MGQERHSKPGFDRAPRLSERIRRGLVMGAVGGLLTFSLLALFGNNRAVGGVLATLAVVFIYLVWERFSRSKG